jgi:hypothetical protein
MQSARFDHRSIRLGDKPRDVRCSTGHPRRSLACSLKPSNERRSSTKLMGTEMFCSSVLLRATKQLVISVCTPPLLCFLVLTSLGSLRADLPYARKHEGQSPFPFLFFMGLSNGVTRGPYSLPMRYCMCIASNSSSRISICSRRSKNSRFCSSRTGADRLRLSSSWPWPYGK